MASTHPNTFHRPLFLFFPRERLSLNSIGFIRLPLWCAMLSKPDELGLLHEKSQQKQPCVFKTRLTVLSYLLRSALVGQMALDRIIPEEWFVLCKVHIWSWLETRERHIICCMTMNSVMEKKLIQIEKLQESTQVVWDDAWPKISPFLEVCVCVCLTYCLNCLWLIWTSICSLTGRLRFSSRAAHTLVPFSAI